MDAPVVSVEIAYFALLREERGVASEKIALPATTVAELYRVLAARHRFSLPANRLQAAVNDEFCSFDRVLSDGDRVVFVPPVAGG